MAIASRQVAFKGIDSFAEDKKTDRGFQKRKAQRKRKKAEKAMGLAADKDDIRYFLLFLPTHSVDERHERITGHRRVKDLIEVLFPDLDDEDVRLRAFDDVVENLRLPKSTRRIHTAQTAKLKEIMRLWANYDSDNDRFLQYLRVSMGQGTLEDLLRSLCEDNDDGARMARVTARHLDELVRGNWTGIRAYNMDHDVRQNLRIFMTALRRENAYESTQYSIKTSSSGKSSDDDEIEEMIF